MIEIAATYNIAILLDSFETGGWMATFEANGDANGNGWGQYIGNRYKKFPNVIYCPETATITLDMTKLKGLVTASWFDPTAAAYTKIGMFSNTGMRNFTTPGNNFAGDPDWVLVLLSN